MAQVHLHIPSFNAGELSPLLGARFAVEKVQSGCRRLRNFIPHVHGPAFRRPGMQYMGPSGANGYKSSLRGFNFSTTTGFVLEFQPGGGPPGKDEMPLPGGLRVWSARDGSQVKLRTPVELPYSEVECGELQTAQVNDVTYIVHRDHLPRRLVRYADDDWRLESINWKWPALGDENVRSTEIATPQVDEVGSVGTHEWPEFIIPSEAPITFTVISPNRDNIAKTAQLWQWVVNKAGKGTWVEKTTMKLTWKTTEPTAKTGVASGQETFWRIIYKGPVHAAADAVLKVSWIGGNATLPLNVAQPASQAPIKVPAGDWQVTVDCPGNLPEGAKLVLQRGKLNTKNVMEWVKYKDLELRPKIILVTRGETLEKATTFRFVWSGRANFGTATIESVVYPPSTDISLACNSTNGPGRTLSASQPIFRAQHVGSFWQIAHRRDATSAELVPGGGLPGGTFAEKISASVRVSGKWDVFTYGDWEAELFLERLVSGQWEVARSWSSRGDRNVIANGEEEEEVEMRLRVTAGKTSASTVATRFILETADGRVYGVVKVTAVGGTPDYGPYLEFSTNGGTTWVKGDKVTIPHGATSVLARTPLLEDSEVEGPEDFTLKVIQPDNLTINREATGRATVVDPTELPVVSVSDVTVLNGVGTAVFTVTLSKPATGTVSVAYATSDDTAKRLKSYTAVDGTLEFSGVTVSQTISVPILNNAEPELDTRTFNLKLEPSVGLAKGDISAVGTILAAAVGTSKPTLRVSSPTVMEGTEFVIFAITLSAPLVKDAVINVTTINGRAVNYTTADGRSTVATVDIISPLLSTDETSFWSEGAWSGVNGYPSAVALHGQRLWFGGTRSEPLRLWGSVVNDYENFRTSSLDDASVSFVPAAQQANALQWMVSHGENLVLGTNGDEWTISGGTDRGPITPTSVLMQRRSGYGSKTLPALLLGESIVFVQRGGRKVRAAGARQDGLVWQATDMTVLSEHLAREGVTQIAVMYFPQTILWAVTATGKLLGMTYEQEQNVFAWHAHETDGLVESVAVVFGVESDQVWVQVRRGDKRMIERLDSRVFALQFESDPPLIYLDSAVQVVGRPADVTVKSENEPEKTTLFTSFSGLGHLDGKKVTMLLNGHETSEVEIKGDTYTVPGHVSTEVATFGLPYTSELQPMRMDLPLADGTAQHRQWRTSRVGLYLHESAGGEVGDGPGAVFESLNFRTTEMDSNQPPPLYSGEVETVIESCARPGADVIVRTSSALPFNVGSITLKGDVYGE